MPEVCISVNASASDELRGEAGPYASSPARLHACRLHHLSGWDLMVETERQDPRRAPVPYLIGVGLRWWAPASLV
jgi:hypothetical protein